MRFAIASLISLFILVATTDAVAQNTLLDARQRLARYDLAGTDTTNVIRSLGAFLSGAASEPEKREARFLRALAAADLVLLAKLRSDDALLERVAGALGVARAEVATHLDAELGQLVVGYYAEAATEARTLLRLTDAQPSDLREAHGIRRDYIYLRAVAGQLSGAADPFAVLEALGEEPCAPPCSGALAAIDPASRKVFASVRELRRIIRDLARAKREGDPFASALDDVESLSSRLASLEVALRYVAPTSLTLPTITGTTAAASATPDAIAFVSAQEIRVAFLPRIIIAADGSASLDSRNPTFPGGTTVRLPASFPQAVTSVPSLVAPLRARFAGARVALASTAEAHLVTRIALTLREAGAEIVAVAARAPGDTLAFFPVALTTQTSNAPLVVIVRPGGYDVTTPQGRFEVERVRDAAGFRHDIDGLARQLRARSFDGAEVRVTRSLPFTSVVGAVSQARSTRPTMITLLP